ncbi:MAG: hypothetical protein RSD88_00565 [Anaerovoracaceae bacterium]
MRKKHYNLLVIPAMMIIVFSLFSGFTNKSTQDVAKDLMRQRTSIIQNTYYHHISEEEGKKQLAKIEVGDLLNRDIRGLETWKDGEFEWIEAMDFETIEITKENKGYTCYDVSIHWQIRGEEKRYATAYKYNVVLKETVGEQKLSVFEPL